MHRHQLENIINNMYLGHLAQKEKSLAQFFDDVNKYTRIMAISTVIDPSQYAAGRKGLLQVDTGFAELTGAGFTPDEIAATLLQRIVALYDDLPSEPLIEAWVSRCLDANASRAALVEGANKWLAEPAASAQNPDGIRSFARQGLRHAIAFAESYVVKPAPAASVNTIQKRPWNEAMEYIADDIEQVKIEGPTSATQCFNTLERMAHHNIAYVHMYRLSEYAAENLRGEFGTDPVAHVNSTYASLREGGISSGLILETLVERVAEHLIEDRPSNTQFDKSFVTAWLENCRADGVDTTAAIRRAQGYLDGTLLVHGMNGEGQVFRPNEENGAVLHDMIAMMRQWSAPAPAAPGTLENDSPL